MLLTASEGSNNKNSSVSLTPKEIAIDKIAAYAESASNPAPTVQDYMDAGVIGI